MVFAASDDSMMGDGNERERERERERDAESEGEIAWKETENGGVKRIWGRNK